MKFLTITNLFGITFLFFSAICSAQSTDLKLKKLTESTNKSMQKDYILEKQASCDLNNDQKQDLILVYKPRNIDTEMESLDTPVILLLSQNSDYIKISNSNILYSYIPDNSVLDINLVTKNEYFTLEQTEGTGSNKRKTYITFKFDKVSKQILLSKYGIETSFPGEKKIVTKTQLFTIKDFGKVKFVDFNSETISSLVK